MCTNDAECASGSAIGNISTMAPHEDPVDKDTKPAANMLAGTRSVGGMLAPIDDDMNDPTCRSRDMLCVCGCMDVLMYVCVYVFMYVYTRICVYVCIH